MTRGQRRYGPPPGYMTSTEVTSLLGKAFYRHVEAGAIRKIAPEGHKHGFYSREDVEVILNAERTFTDATRGGALHNQDAVFTYATLGDMDALYTCARKFFPNPANAEVRRAWMRKEPRGHYLMKRISDGAVVAYMYLLSLKPEYLDDYMHGRLPGRMITPDHIERFEPGKPVEACIINAIQSDPDVEQKLRSTYVAMLLRGVKQDIGMLGREGIIIPRLYAWSESNEGIALCTRLGMEPWEEPHGKRCFFVLHMDKSNAIITRDYRRGLAQWQETRQEGQQTALYSIPSHHKHIREQVATVPREPRPAAISQGNVPADTIPLKDFLHGMSVSTIKRNVEMEVGDWRGADGHVINRVLTPEQQHTFWEWAHNRPGFVACSECPHGA